jgi:hypothetical protein
VSQVLDITPSGFKHARHEFERAGVVALCRKCHRTTDATVKPANDLSAAFRRKDPGAASLSSAWCKRRAILERLASIASPAVSRMSLYPWNSYRKVVLTLLQAMSRRSDKEEDPVKMQLISGLSAIALLAAAGIAVAQDKGGRGAPPGAAPGASPGNAGAGEMGAGNASPSAERGNEGGPASEKGGAPETKTGSHSVMSGGETR